MKKITLMIAALALTTGAFAQTMNQRAERTTRQVERTMNEWERQGWSFGVKAGVNFANISDFGYDNDKMKTGFYAGLFAEYRLNYWFGVQSELVYSAQGNRFDLADASLKTKLGYLNIPMLAKFYVLDGLSVDFGPQFGFLVNKEIDLREPRPGAVVDGDRNKTNGFDFAVAIGLNYTLMEHLDITARYNLGLTDTFKNLHGTNRNGVIQVGLGYRF